METQVLKDRLKDFCCPYEGRLDAPWNSDGKTYATNGQMAIRVDSEIPYENPKWRTVDVDSVLGDWSKVTEWNQFPEAMTCEVCDDGKPKMEFCDRCSGTGICICSCDNEHDCGFCGGSGEQPRDCNCVTQVGDRAIRTINLRRITKLPEVRWGVSEPGFDQVVFFKFDGGIGAVMPVNTGKEQRTGG